MIAHPDKIFHFFKYITLNYTPRTSFSQLITKFDLKVLSVNLWLYIFCASCLLYLPCEALLWGFYSRIIRSQVKNWVMFVCSGRRLTWRSSDEKCTVSLINQFVLSQKVYRWIVTFVRTKSNGNRYLTLFWINTRININKLNKLFKYWLRFCLVIVIHGVARTVHVKRIE